MTLTDALIYIAYNVPAVVCVLCGAYLCLRDKQGWGWFLFAGLMVSRFPDLKHFRNKYDEVEMKKANIEANVDGLMQGPMDIPLREGDKLVDSQGRTGTAIKAISSENTVTVQLTDDEGNIFSRDINELTPRRQFVEATLFLEKEERQPFKDMLDSYNKGESGAL